MDKLLTDLYYANVGDTVLTDDIYKFTVRENSEDFFAVYNHNEFQTDMFKSAESFLQYVKDRYRVRVTQVV